VEKKKKKYWFAGVVLLFISYVFIAARPVPVETILSPQWLSSLESTYPDFSSGDEPGENREFLPFQLGDRFGYVDSSGRFTLNQVKKGYISLSKEYWAEYDPVPGTIEVRNPLNEEILTIENPRGYPLFLDKKIFLLNNEQNSLSALDDSGNVRWTYDFAAHLTAIDAAAGFTLAGSLDGTVEVLNDQGVRIFFFEPGGSRLSVILGCAISKDGSKLAIISGIDDQRFLLLDRLGEAEGNEYKVLYHEFLNDGFRRPVHISFIDHDNCIAFECQGGLGVYNIAARTGIKIPLEGEIAALDGSGNDHLLFAVTSQSKQQKRLVAIRLPGTVIIEAPFKSETAFFSREGSRIYIGGGMTLASFELDKR
jgi:hypothetical protein